MILTKAEINQSISLSDGDIEKLKGMPGPIYLVNSNNGNINTQNNVNADSLSAGLVNLYNQGIGLYGILEQVRRLVVQLAIIDCGNQKRAAAKLKISRSALNDYLAATNMKYKQIKELHFPKEKGPGENAQALAE